MMSHHVSLEVAFLSRAVFTARAGERFLIRMDPSMSSGTGGRRESSKTELASVFVNFVNHVRWVVSIGIICKSELMSMRTRATKFGSEPGIQDTRKSRSTLIFVT